MFHSALICTDFHDGLDRFTSTIEDLAAAGLRRVVFVHCVPLWDEGAIPHADEGAIARARVRLTPAIQTLGGEVDVRIEVASGRPGDWIPQLEKTHGCEVLLLGTPTRNLLQEQLFGSTSLDLLKTVHQPLMILRPPLLMAYRQEELRLRCRHLWQRLLVPYNHTAGAQALVARLYQRFEALDPAIRRETAIHFGTVVDDSARWGTEAPGQVTEAQGHLDDLLQRWGDLGVGLSGEVRLGNPLQETLAMARDQDVSAIVLATAPRRKLMELTVPSFVSEVMRRSWFPVLLFPLAV